jgi:DNA-binding response OmpR family regulator
MPARSLSDCPILLRGKRIFVVEDEAIVAMLIEDELLGAGAEVVGPAGSVGDASQLIEAAAADGGLSAAVLDINLDGEAVRPVADTLAALGVPFLFATGYGEHCDTGGHAGAQVLHKPFDRHELLVAITDLMPDALATQPSPQGAAISL